MYNAKPVFYRIMNTRCVRQLNNQMMDIPRLSFEYDFEFISLS